MNEKLISGYAAYTTADEYATSAVADAPATIWTIYVVYATATLGAGTITTAKHGC